MPNVCGLSTVLGRVLFGRFLQAVRFHAEFRLFGSLAHAVLGSPCSGFRRCKDGFVIESVRVVYARAHAALGAEYEQGRG